MKNNEILNNALSVATSIAYTKKEVAILKEELEEINKEEKEVDKHPYLSKPFTHFKDLKPMVQNPPAPSSIDDIEIPVFGKSPGVENKTIAVEKCSVKTQKLKLQFLKKE